MAAYRYGLRWNIDIETGYRYGAGGSDFNIVELLKFLGAGIQFFEAYFQSPESGVT